MKIFTFFICFFTSLQLSAQNTYLPYAKNQGVYDSLYREDQFYIGISHTMIMGSPSNLKTNGISPMIHLGFIRDFPINKERNQAIGVGIGAAYQNYKTNLLILSPENNNFTINNSYKTNYLKTYTLEVPIEYRWRTSTITNHKFWRFYTGLKYAYTFHSDNFYSGSLGEFTYTNFDKLNKHHINYYFSLGYNAWNFYASVQLTPLYKKGILPNNKNLYPIHLGLIFYIL